MESRVGPDSIGIKKELDEEEDSVTDEVAVVLDTSLVTLRIPVKNIGELSLL